MITPVKKVSLPKNTYGLKKRVFFGKKENKKSAQVDDFKDIMKKFSKKHLTK